MSYSACQIGTNRILLVSRMALSGLTVDMTSPKQGSR
jgi:hypothetical protein